MTKPNFRAGGAAASLLFLVVFGVYLFTALPTIVFEDTGEFPVSAVVLGVSHPPGYPIYLLLGKLFSVLPFGEPAFGVVAFSCFCGALACCVVFAACRMFGFSGAGSFVSGGMLGFSLTLWSQGVISEVYALQMLLSAALLCCVAGVRGEGRIGWVLWGAFFLGLNFLNQYIAFVAFAPVVFVCFVWVCLRVRGGAPAVAAGAVLMMGAVVSAAMCLPLRAAASPPLMWGYADTFHGFVEHLKRSQFLFYENQLGFDVGTKLKYAALFIKDTPAEFTPLFFFAGMFGVFLLLMERWKLSALLLYLFAVHSVGVILFINFHFTPEYVSVFRVFYLGAYLAAAVAAGAGVDGMAWRAGGGGGRLVRVGAVLLLAWPLAANFGANDWRGEDRSLRFGFDFMRLMRRDGVYFNVGALHTPAAEYLRIVRNMRGDVEVVDGHGIMMRSNIEKFGHKYNYMDMPEIQLQLMKGLFGRARMYFAYDIMPDLGARAAVEMKNLGPLFELVPAAGDAPCDLSVWGGPAGDFNYGGRSGGFSTDMVDGFVMLRKAQCSLQLGDTVAGFDTLKRLSERFPEDAFVSTSIAGVLLKYGYESRAVKYYNDAIRQCPTYTDAYSKLGDIYTRKGKIGKAKDMYRRAILLNPMGFTAMMNLANVHQYRGEYDDALGLYGRVLVLQPDAALVYNNMGNTYSAMGRYEEARRAYRKAMSLSPMLSYTYNNLAALEMRMGEYGSAVATMRKYLKMEPESATGWLNLGIAFEGEDNYNEAVASYRKVTELQPGDLRAWKKVFELREAMGDRDGALKTIDEIRAMSGEIAAAAGVAKSSGKVPGHQVKLMKENAMRLEGLAGMLEKELKR